MKRVLAMLGLTNVVAVALLVFMFQQLARQGMPDGLQWALLYVAAVMAPSWWTYQHYVEFARMGIPATGKTRHLAWSPVAAGLSTLLIALAALVRG